MKKKIDVREMQRHIDDSGLTAKNSQCATSLWKHATLTSTHIGQTSPWRVVDITTLSVNAVCILKDSYTSIATTVVHEKDM